MTNKMPVVGQRYRRKLDGKIFTLSKIFDDHMRSMIMDNDDGLWMQPVKDTFWLSFEELQEDKKEVLKPEPKWLSMESAPEEEWVLLTDGEQIRTARFKPKDGILYGQWYVYLNLESDKVIYNPTHWMPLPKLPLDMSKPELKIDIKEERVEPVSIWKDVNELPVNVADCLIKTKPNVGVWLGAFHPNNSDYGMFKAIEGGTISKEQTEKYCTLTDFVNSFEQMQKDIEELKKR